MRGIEHACVISASTTCMELSAEATRSAPELACEKEPAEIAEQWGQEEIYRAKHIRLYIVSNNEMHFRICKLEGMAK